MYPAADWSCNPSDTPPCLLEVGTTGEASGVDTGTALEFLNDGEPASTVSNHKRRATHIAVRGPWHAVAAR